MYLGLRCEYACEAVTNRVQDLQRDAFAQWVDDAGRWWYYGGVGPNIQQMHCVCRWVLCHVAIRTCSIDERHAHVLHAQNAVNLSLNKKKKSLNKGQKRVFHSRGCEGYDFFFDFLIFLNSSSSVI